MSQRASPDFEIQDYDPPRPYARGARVGNIVYLSGATGIDVSQRVVPGGIGPQTEQMIKNIRADLRAFGSDLEYVIRATVYMINPDDTAVYRQIRDRYLTRPLPGTRVYVARLADPEMLIEMEVMALVPPQNGQDGEDLGEAALPE
jgi:2-iminobutanoate/2-iminopropanoate deaminase